VLLVAKACIRKTMLKLDYTGNLLETISELGTSVLEDEGLWSALHVLLIYIISIVFILIFFI